jgi:pilus assembly protein Flp/PilA
MARKFTRILKGLWTDDAGVTAIEYGLIAALIAVIIITAVALVGTDLSNMFNTIANNI